MSFVLWNRSRPYCESIFFCCQTDLWSIDLFKWYLISESDKSICLGPASIIHVTSMILSIFLPDVFNRRFAPGWKFEGIPQRWNLCELHGPLIIKYFQRRDKGNCKSFFLHRTLSAFPIHRYKNQALLKHFITLPLTLFLYGLGSLSSSIPPLLHRSSVLFWYIFEDTQI